MTRKLLKLKIEPEDAGTRLDRCLSRLIQDSSRSYLQKLIKNGQVRCDGEVVTLPRLAVNPGMELSVELDEAPDTTPRAEEFVFQILFEDESMVVINKPPGVVVHPAVGNPTGTVVNALLGRYPELAETLATGNSRPGIVHRLDKDTSGCLIAAKTPQAQFRLANSFAERQVAKTYKAIVLGVPRRKNGRVESLIGRHPVNRQKMAIVERNGKEAITLFELERSGLYESVPVSLLNVNILTGRTHQIRVHLASLGYPVLGDALYGGNRLLHVERQLLHAWKIRIPHPVTGVMLEFEAPLPEDFTEILLQMRPLEH